MKTKPVEEIIILSEKKRRNIKRIKKSIIKMEHCKISKLLNDSSISKFVKKKDHSKRFMKLSIFCQQKYKV